jgi:hypothetical protein
MQNDCWKKKEGEEIEDNSSFSTSITHDDKGTIDGTTNSSSNQHLGQLEQIAGSVNVTKIRNKVFCIHVS